MDFLPRKKGISTTLLTAMGKHFVLAGKFQIDFGNLSCSVNHPAINVQPYMVHVLHGLDEANYKSLRIK